MGGVPELNLFCGGVQSWLCDPLVLVVVFVFAALVLS